MMLVEHARKALNMPPEWDGFEFSCLPTPTDGQRDWKATHFRVRGAIAPLKTKGESKGYRNWKKRDRSTEREFITSISEHDEWCLQWEIETGKCSICMGSGKTLARVSAEGTEYRSCSKCSGTGKGGAA